VKPAYAPPDPTRYPAFTFLSCGVREAGRTALSAAAGRNLVVSGADVVRQCLEEGLVDEIQIHLVPVLLGAGVRLFDRPGTDWIRLERTGLAASGQITDLRFRVMKPATVASVAS
jgi:dihydrofolate reductase